MHLPEAVFLDASNIGQRFEPRVVGNGAVGGLKSRLDSSDRRPWGPSSAEKDNVIVRTCR